MERRKKNALKKKRMKEKRSLREQMMLKKASSMLGVGPISEEAVRYYEKETKNNDDARKEAVKEFLAYQLGFVEEELKDMNILETKRANKEDVIYFVIEDIDTIKEIYYRKGDSKNDDIIVRNYIPPQIHARYMAVNRECMEEKRNNDRLKTQIRFGRNDLELYTKMKGAEEPFKMVEP